MMHGYGVLLGEGFPSLLGSPGRLIGSISAPVGFLAAGFLAEPAAPYCFCTFGRALAWPDRPSLRSKGHQPRRVGLEPRGSAKPA